MKNTKRNLSAAGICMMMAAFTVCSCINDEYSVKNIDDEMSLLPGLTIEKHAQSAIPVEEVLSSLNKEGCLNFDKSGDYWLSGKSADGLTEVSFSVQKTYYNSTNRFKLEEVALFFQPSDMVELLSPLQLELYNPAPDDLELSMIVVAGLDRIELEGIPVKPGANTIILDDEKTMNFLKSKKDEIFAVSKFYLSKKSAITNSSVPASTVNDASSYTFTVKVSRPVELYAGQSVEYEYLLSLDEKFDLDDINSDYLNKHLVLDLNLSVVNSIPADIDLSINKESEQYYFEGTISGLGRINAGTVSSPATTDMIWTIESDHGIQGTLPVVVKAIVSDKEGSTVRFNKDQEISLNVNSIKFVNGI